MNDELVYDVTDAEYHAHPALSASGAKRLLPPSCPARFKWERDNGRPNKREYDVGSAAHAAVLGTGWPLVVVDAPDWRTKAAKEKRDEAYANGHVPILASEKENVDRMAAALLQHPRAAALLNPEHGKPEVSAFWHDKRHSIDRRARFDWLPETDGGRLVVPDYKTTSSAEPFRFARSVFDFKYDLQAVFYMDALQALEVADDIVFTFIAQETTPPYLITVHELDTVALRLGRERVDRACALFAECTATDTWPGYSDGVEYVTPPLWLTDEYGLDLDMESVP